MLEKIGLKSYRTKLLYQGTRDGFKASSFHTLCDSKGPTLTLVKSEYNKIFGGLAKVSWGK
jgi:hypothetical protein